MLFDRLFITTDDLRQNGQFCILMSKPLTVARELFSGRGAQLTFAGAFHDRKEPGVPPNIVFSSV